MIGKDNQTQGGGKKGKCIKIYLWQQNEENGTKTWNMGEIIAKKETYYPRNLNLRIFVEDNKMQNAWGGG